MYKKSYRTNKRQQSLLFSPYIYVFLLRFLFVFSFSIHRQCSICKRYIKCTNLFKITIRIYCVDFLNFNLNGERNKSSSRKSEYLK